jgi:predicted NUDIX family NTP pyrophosphohydrolase
MAAMAVKATIRRSAGLLVYRSGARGLEVFLGHMGGPFWAHKHERAWSVPKGEYVGDEAPLDAARREFAEETALAVPPGELRPLGTVTQSRGKEVAVWAVEGDLDADAAVSNTFRMMWPPRSGQWQTYPEMDRFAWADLDTGRALLVKAQVEFLDRLMELLVPGADR